ncbi:MAG TPA: hypothetical protein VD913_06310, partial [bacterium]|nr:hypothetical protein [bacterium]
MITPAKPAPGMASALASPKAGIVNGVNRIPKIKANIETAQTAVDGVPVSKYHSASGLTIRSWKSSLSLPRKV